MQVLRAVFRGGLGWLAPLIMLFGTAATAASSGDKTIALTFEDLPYMKPLGYWEPREVSNMILRTLEREGIPAAGFVSEEKIDDDTTSFIVLEDWAQRGHLLGNQTYSDVDLHQLSAEDFLAHVADGQKYLRRLGSRFKFNFRYLRFPLLHEGDTPGKKKDVRSALRHGGYELAPVTVRTSSYVFNRPYLEIQYEPEQVASLKRLYLDHIAESIEYAEAQSDAVFGRQIPHILQLHCGIATGAFLEDVITLLKSRGYRFVSLLDALADEAYQTEESYVGPLGLTFIDRVAYTRGLPFDAAKGDLPDTEVEKRLQALPRR